VYGAFRAGSVITEFTTRMLQGRRPLVYGTGHQERDFVHVADVVSATLKAVRLSRRNRGDVLDIASGERISVLGLVSMLNDILGTQLEPIFLPERASDVRVPPLQNMSKSEDILGWKPSIPLYEGIREYVLSQTASG
jgi:UDP-glucose 4-epimerase